MTALTENAVPQVAASWHLLNKMTPSPPYCRELPPGRAFLQPFFIAPASRVAPPLLFKKWKTRGTPSTPGTSYIISWRFDGQKYEAQQQLQSTQYEKHNMRYYCRSVDSIIVTHALCDQRLLFGTDTTALCAPVEVAFSTVTNHRYRFKFVIIVFSYYYIIIPYCYY